MQALNEALIKAFPEFDPSAYPWPDADLGLQMGTGWVAAPEAKSIDLKVCVLVRMWVDVGVCAGSYVGGCGCVGVCAGSYVGGCGCVGVCAGSYVGGCGCVCWFICGWMWVCGCGCGYGCKSVFGWAWECLQVWEWVWMWVGVGVGVGMVRLCRCGGNGCGARGGIADRVTKYQRR